MPESTRRVAECSDVRVALVCRQPRLSADQFVVGRTSAAIIDHYTVGCPDMGGCDVMGLTSAWSVMASYVLAIS